ncbi:MAG: polymer-forming cytoskeletal protein [Polyangiaceae bacterium]|nr:polymer-forming cytoskeletal protein [Polyangiaceae bacterium]
MARHGSSISVLGRATRVTGRVSGRGGLSIEGSLRGDVAVTGPVFVAKGASVEGNVRAESLEVEGTLLGDALTEGAILVRAGATVRGELKGSEISIEAGARVAVKLDTARETAGKGAPGAR